MCADQLQLPNDSPSVTLEAGVQFRFPFLFGGFTSPRGKCDTFGRAASAV
eukprot:TRINITY_DN3676_c0_g1_i1.p3 TRINITY_DN3676_c0_g1~~TRINITY_DN3676_c0_g1_i1.p3  ORF type:complete len:50 (+),score=4.31 TRINITY_DN3676_c0_g1_i1:246-395(+)